jgi:hypothetical protein
MLETLIVRSIEMESIKYFTENFFSLAELLRGASMHLATGFVIVPDGVGIMISSEKG